LCIPQLIGDRRELGASCWERWLIISCQRIVLSNELKMVVESTDFFLCLVYILRVCSCSILFHVRIGVCPGRPSVLLKIWYIYIYIYTGFIYSSKHPINNMCVYLEDSRFFGWLYTEYSHYGKNVERRVDWIWWLENLFYRRAINKNKIEWFVSDKMQ
jgi:hypothetical protein